MALSSAISLAASAALNEEPPAPTRVLKKEERRDMEW
jgi:hypothetical protein